jgi:hypothetical protein
VAGKPNWTVVAWALFVAPFGKMSDPGTTLDASFSAVWAPNHAYDPGFNQFKSVVSHAPPYDGELLSGLAQTSFTNTGCVPASAFVPPSGVLWSAIMVPSASAPSGTSFEVSSPGPIIPGMFAVSGALIRDGLVVDPNWSSTYAAASKLYAANYDGFRHVILNFAENTDFSGGAALPAGNYAFKVYINDQGLSGSTTQTIHFTVY